MLDNGRYVGSEELLTLVYEKPLGSGVLTSVSWSNVVCGMILSLIDMA